MSSGLTRASRDALTRGEWRLLDELGALSHLTVDDQRRLLSLSEAEWTAWRRFLRGDPQSAGALPPGPRLPEMLLRLASAAYGITVLLDPDPLGFDIAAW
jgi:hypothetical protein